MAITTITTTLHIYGIECISGVGILRVSAPKRRRSATSVSVGFSELYIYTRRKMLTMLFRRLNQPEDPTIGHQPSAALRNSHRL